MGAWEAFTMNVLFIGLLLIMSAGFYILYLVINLLLTKKQNMKSEIEINFNEYDLVESNSYKMVFRRKGEFRDDNK